MNYYALILKDAKEKQSPQVDIVIEQDYDFNAPYSVWNLKNEMKVIDVIKMPKLILHPNAILTDVLKAIPFNSHFTILCNQKFLAILEEYNTSAYEVFPVSVFKENEEYKYFLINFYETCNESVDFKGSEFFLRPPSISLNQKKREKKEILINSLEEYQNQKEIHLSVETRTLKLKNNLPYDLFKLRIGKIAFYISDTLKERLEFEGLRGFQCYKPINGNNTFLMDRSKMYMM